MKKSTKIMLAVIVLLVVVRLILPHFITNYVNKVLAQVEGYEGSISGVSLAIYRGAYQIHDLTLSSVEKEVKTPFVEIKSIDISVEWRALLDGSIVGEIILIEAELNFAVSESEAEGVQTGEENDWTKTITDLLPLQINRFELVDSKINYIDDTSEPVVKLFFDDLDVVATNLNNSTDNKDLLPSKIIGSSHSIGDGNFNIDMNINILKEIPDFDLNMKLENVDMVALNDFFRTYANIDAESGKFNFYTELTLVDSEMDGYFKPLTKDLKILQWKTEDKGFFGKIREALIGFGINIIENQNKGQVGTKVPISGNIENTKIGVWTSILQFLKNAYIKPLQKEIDETIKVGSGEENEEKEKD